LAVVPLLLRELPDPSRLARFLGSEEDAEALLTLLELLRVARDAYATLESNFARYALTDAKWAMLMKLYVEPEQRLLPSALAAQLLVTRGAISGLVRGGERAGLVRRVPHPTDRRKYYVVLLPRGRRLVSRALPGHIDRITFYLSVLAPAERRSLGVALRKLYAALPRLAAPGVAAGAARAGRRRNRTSLGFG
jgi:DNA-binding MarR family transcriptional regulator